MNLQGGSLAKEYFGTRLGIIYNAIDENAIIFGIFNLDWSKKDLRNYHFNSYFNLLTLCFVMLTYYR
jgi:hypothetical protein